MAYGGRLFHQMEDYIVRRYSWLNVPLHTKKIFRGVGFRCLSVAACRHGQGWTRPLLGWVVRKRAVAPLPCRGAALLRPLHCGVQFTLPEHVVAGPGEL